MLSFFRPVVPNPAHTAYLSRRVFGSLNGLRFLCIAAVMWHHSPLNGATQGIRLLDRGFVGVDFFFVLSGFLITTLLLREERATGRISLRGFYWRRALRILPVYLLVVAAMALFWVVVKGRADLAGLVPYYLVFLANFLKQDIPLLSITWSLSVEEQYYLVWPAILLLLPPTVGFRAGLLAGAILFSLLVMLGLADWLALPVVETPHARFAWPGMSYQAILLGSLLAVLLNTARGFAVLARLTGGRWAAAWWFLALLGWLHGAPADLMGWPALVMDLLMALTLSSLVIREDNALRPALSWRPVARVGEISYGLYLYHLIGLHIANEIADLAGLAGLGRAGFVTLLFPMFSIAMAEISFRFYERRFLRLKDWRRTQPRSAGLR